MLRSSFALFLLLILSLFYSCSIDNWEDGDIQIKKAPPESSTPCATAFLSQNNLPGSVITIRSMSAWEIVSEFTMNSTVWNTDYVTLETDQTNQWTSSISLPGQVLYCSCGENYGVLQHGPAASKFTTSDDGSTYNWCSF